MARGRLAVAVVLAATLGGCGGASTDDRVEAYVQAVNAAQTSSAADFRTANRSYTQFIRRRVTGAPAVQRLRAAETSIRRTRARLERVPAPPAARRLRAQLLHVYALNAELAHETVLLAAYTPARSRALRPVAVANRALSGALHGAAQPADQAAAFTAYRDRLARAIAAFRRLRPPPVARAANRQELGRLEASARLAGELRDAVLARDSKRTAQLVLAFRRLSRLRAGERAVQQRALAAYAARRRAIATAVGRLQRERARLARS